MSQNIIQYHTQIHRELKVFLIPCKQLHLSLSRLLGTNPTNRAKTTRRVMTLWTTQGKDVLIQVCSARRNQPVPLRYKTQQLFRGSISLSLWYQVKRLKKKKRRCIKKLHSRQKWGCLSFCPFLTHWESPTVIYTWTTGTHSGIVLISKLWNPCSCALLYRLSWHCVVSSGPKVPFKIYLVGFPCKQRQLCLHSY